MNIIIDGNYSLHKNFHVFKNFSKGDLFTGTLFGAVRDIALLKKKYAVENDKIHVTWDSRSFRKDLNENYKANRIMEKGHNAYSNFSLVKEGLCALGVHQYYAEGFESDDLIYTLSLKLEGNKVIFSKDRDLLQCLSNDTTLLWSLKDLEYGIAQFEEQYGFPFSRNNFITYKSIIGDPSDNIKGIPRFPKKESIALLNKKEVSKKALDLIRINFDLIKKNEEIFCLKMIEKYDHSYSPRNEDLLCVLREKTAIKIL